MAITINIYYRDKDGNSKRFVEEMINSGIVADIRLEEGNLRYEYFYSEEDKETVLLIDSWVNQEALDFHHSSPMMKKIIELREKYDLHMHVERYVSDSMDKDKEFIRT